MQLETFWSENNETHFVESFRYAKQLPSGHTEIFFSDKHSVHYNILFVDFVREWNRMH